MFSVLRRTKCYQTHLRSLCSSLGAMTGFYDEIYTSDGTLKFYVKGEWRTSKSGKTVSAARLPRA